MPCVSEGWDQKERFHKEVNQVTDLTPWQGLPLEYLWSAFKWLCVLLPEESTPLSDGNRIQSFLWVNNSSSIPCTLQKPDSLDLGVSPRVITLFDHYRPHSQPPGTVIGWKNGISTWTQSGKTVSKSLEWKLQEVILPLQNLKVEKCKSECVVDHNTEPRNRLLWQGLNTELNYLKLALS